ncbi:MAG: DUF6597 domain-containing transcriptional factor, partial [Bacteroidota bacterium]
MTPSIFQPHSDLAPFVKCYWTLEGPAETTPTRNTIVPDGCMKPIFDYPDDVYRGLCSEKSVSYSHLARWYC